jgi:exosortase
MQPKVRKERRSFLKSSSANRKWDRSSESTAMHSVSFMVFVAAGIALYWSPIASLLRLVDKSELFSHIPLIPFVSGYFLVIDRKKLLTDLGWDYRKGVALLGVAALIRWFAEGCLPNPYTNDCLSLNMLGFVIWVQGCFVFSYGVSAVKHILFPSMFLVFLIPIPSHILNPFVRFLQVGSAQAAYWIFKLVHTPVYREGFVFSLPGFTVEVAEQCSGIRSSIALFIIAIVAGKLFLKRGWSRAVLAVSVFPIAMFKNALRIVTLSLLASYVDPRFITNSWLHKSGGIPFFGIALLLLWPVLWGLRKGERKKGVAQITGRQARKLGIQEHA